MICRVITIASSGTCREQSVECRFAKPDKHRIANGHHRGATRLASDEAHFANDLAAAHFATGTRHAILVIHVGAQPSAEHQIHGVAGLALGHERLPAGHLDPFQAVAHDVECRGFDVLQVGLQMPIKQFVLEVLSHG